MARIILGGWGISPKIVELFFQCPGLYLDINELTPRLINEDILHPEWISIARRWIASRAGKHASMLGGWSTGAILAWAVRGYFQPDRMVLLSPTPSFRRRRGFIHGWKPAVLAAMRREIAEDPGSFWPRFYTQCGLGEGSPARQWPRPGQEALIAGLRFLEQVSLLPLSKPACPIDVYHGLDDRIIPVEAGKYFARHTGAALHEMPGGHAFFSGEAASARG